MTSQVQAAPNGVDCVVTWKDSADPLRNARVNWSPLTGNPACTGVITAAALHGTVLNNGSENWGQVIQVADRAAAVTAIAAAIGAV